MVSRADRIVRDVIQKEKPGRETKQETQSEIAVTRGELGLH
jgi:Trp operon repressor